jgi:hypothetical protein
MEKTGQRWLSKLVDAPKAAVRSISGVAPDAKMGVRDYARAVWSPRYKGLDRPPSVNSSGFLKPLKPSGLKSLIPAGWNPPKPGARTLDRTRQSAANALRLSNKAVPVAAAAGGVYQTGENVLYGYPRMIGETTGDLAGLNEADTDALVKSMQGLNALKLLPHSLSSNDPFAQELWRQARRDVYPSMQRAAHSRLENRPVQSNVVDAFRMLSPFGMASTAVQRGIADPMPKIPREDHRRFYGDLAAAGLQDPESIKNSPLLAKLTEQVDPDIRRRIIAGLYRRGTGNELASTESRGVTLGDAASKGLNAVRQRMEQEGIPSSGVPSAGRALVDAAYGGPSKDVEREKELWRNELQGTGLYTKDTLKTLPRAPIESLTDEQRDTWREAYARRNELSRSLSQLHPSYRYKDQKSTALGDMLYTSLQQPDFKMPPAISKYLEESGVPVSEVVSQIAAMPPRERMRLYAPEGTDDRYPDDRSKRPLDPAGVRGLYRSGVYDDKSEPKLTLRIDPSGVDSFPGQWRPAVYSPPSSFGGHTKSPLEKFIHISKVLADVPDWVSHGKQPLSQESPGHQRIVRESWRDRYPTPADEPQLSLGLKRGLGGLHYDPNNPIATMRAYADLVDDKQDAYHDWKHHLDATLAQLEQDPRMFGVDVRKLLLKEFTRRYRNSEQGRRVEGMWRK